MDATYLETQRLETIRLSDDEMRKRYLFETDERSLERANLRREIVEELRRSALEEDVLKAEFEQLMRDRQEVNNNKRRWWLFASSFCDI